MWTYAIFYRYTQIFSQMGTSQGQRAGPPMLRSWSGSPVLGLHPVLFRSGGSGKTCLKLVWKVHMHLGVWSFVFFSEKISLLLFIDMFLEIGTRMIYRYQIWSFSNLGGRMMLHIGAVCDSLPLHYIQANDKVFFPQAECRILQHPCFLIEHMINAAFTCGTEDLRELPRYFECCV